MSDFRFQDEKFSNRTGWTHFYQDERFDQRYWDDNRLMFTETIMSVRCSLETAIVRLNGPWSWWDHGCCLDFRLDSDGSSSQFLKPAAWFWTKIRMHIFPPIALPDINGFRLPIILSKHFVGVASFDVYPSLTADDTIILRGRFHGVENHVPLVPLWMATKRHLRAEAGTFLFPYPRGTGWVGLYRRLEADHARDIAGNNPNEPQYDDKPVNELLHV